MKGAGGRVRVKCLSRGRGLSNSGIVGLETQRCLYDARRKKETKMDGCSLKVAGGTMRKEGVRSNLAVPGLSERLGGRNGAAQERRSSWFFAVLALISPFRLAGDGRPGTVLMPQAYTLAEGTHALVKSSSGLASRLRRAPTPGIANDNNFTRRCLRKELFCLCAPFILRT